MPYIPHTQEEIKEMLAVCGVSDVNELFDEIPSSLINTVNTGVFPSMSEMAVARFLKERANQNHRLSCFAGAGAYDHYIPAPVWQLVSRGEFMTAYTPYQAEASQGTLQLLYEYQTMIASLTGMDASNASMYDGATALAEAVLMAVRANRKVKSKNVLMPKNIDPKYREVVRSIVSLQDIEIINVDYDEKSGTIINLPDVEFSALIISLPNFFGRLEAVNQLTNFAHSKNALVIGLVNPVALALLKPPGEWGDKGADIACGDGQPLGIPLSMGGPYFGFLTCKKEHIRQMPGRIIGATVDEKGRRGFVLTLQAREQHIRRSKATSNICSNQGLMAAAATIYLCLKGPDGLKETALLSHKNMQYFIDEATKLKDVDVLFSGSFFHETVLRLPISPSEFIKKMEKHGILAGFDLSTDYPELGNALLVCCTETKTKDDIDLYVRVMKEVL